jgi:hypothetical protein
MILHLLTRRGILLEPTTRADKSAMGAVNRPLRRSLAYTWFIHPDYGIHLFSERLHDKIIVMSEQSQLQTELEYFQEHKQEYLKLFKGQFVLIKGEQFAGTYTTEAEAYKAGLEKFGKSSLSRGLCK